MHVFHTDAGIMQVFGQVFGHALCQRPHKHTLFHLGALEYLFHKIIDLTLGLPNLNRRIDKSGWPDNLLDNRAGFFNFVFRGCRRNKNGSFHKTFKFFEF